MNPGVKADLNLLREGKNKTLEITIGEQPSDFFSVPVTETKQAEYFGITAAEITKEIRQKYNLAEDATGVVVVNVENGSAAAMAAIKEGSVIIQLNRKEIKTLDDYTSLMKKAEKEGTVLILLQEKRGSRFVLLEKER